MLPNSMQFFTEKVSVVGSSTALVVSAIYSFLRILVGHSDFQLELGIFEIQCLMDPTIRPDLVYSDDLHIIFLFAFCVQDSHL